MSEPVSLVVNWTAGDLEQTFTTSLTNPPQKKQTKTIDHWSSNPWKQGSVLHLVRNVLFHCVPAVSKVEVYLEGRHSKKWSSCSGDRMDDGIVKGTGNARYRDKGNCFWSSHLWLQRATYGSRLSGFIAKHKENRKQLLQRPRANMACLVLMAPIQQIVHLRPLRYEADSASIPADPFKSEGWYFAHGKRRWSFIHPSSWIYFPSLWVLCPLCIAGVFIAAVQRATRKNASTPFGSQATSSFSLKV